MKALLEDKSLLSLTMARNNDWSQRSEVSAVGGILGAWSIRGGFPLTYFPSLLLIVKSVFGAENVRYKADADDRLYPGSFLHWPPPLHAMDPSSVVFNLIGVALQIQSAVEIVSVHILDIPEIALMWLSSIEESTQYPDYAPNTGHPKFLRETS